jgi:hypothetical protein
VCPAIPLESDRDAEPDVRGPRRVNAIRRTPRSPGRRRCVRPSGGACACCRERPTRWCSLGASLLPADGANRASTPNDALQASRGRTERTLLVSRGGVGLRRVHRLGSATSRLTCAVLYLYAEADHTCRPPPRTSPRQQPLSSSVRDDGAGSAKDVARTAPTTMSGPMGQVGSHGRAPAVRSPETAGPREPADNGRRGSSGRGESLLWCERVGGTRLPDDIVSPAA